MKVRVEMEVDLQTGTYDVRFQNLSSPGAEIDLTKLSKVVVRVLDNVAIKSSQPSLPTLAPLKANIN